MTKSTVTKIWVGSLIAITRGVVLLAQLQQLIKDRRGHWPDRAIGPMVPEGV